MKVKILSAAVLFFLGNAAFAQNAKKDTLESAIEEVVVVAYGKQKKETVVGSNTQISSDKIEDRSISNALQVVEGATSGVQMTAASGQPGSSPNIRIRGVGSYSGSNEPLYVVDGFPFNGGIESINPSDIQSINILKDAAATSLYGSSAANGVVMITTKTGRRGRSVVNFSASTGYSERAVPQYSRLGPKDYYLINWEAIRNGELASGKSLADANAAASAGLIDILKQNVYNVPNDQLVVDGVFNPNAQLLYTDLDWDEAVARSGFRQMYDMNYSGGTDKMKYFASLGYLDEKGYVINSDFQRFTGRLNVESQLKDWMKVGINIAGTNTYSNNAVDGASSPNSIVNPYYFSRRMGPIYSPYLHDANGNNIYDADGNKVYDLEQNRGANAYGGRHTIVENTLNKDFNKIFNVNTRFMAEFRLMKDLYLTSNVGYDTRNRNRLEYTNRLIGDAAPAGAGERTTYVTQTILWNQLLNYKKSFGNHNFEALVGHESSKLIYEYLNGRKQGQVVEGIDDLINFVTPTTLTSYTDHYNKESYFSRLNYDFRNKYIVSGSVRWDGSSRFAKDVRWDSFWSVGLGWKVDNESFMENIGFIDDLKLRASYGEVGNDRIGSYYAYQSVFGLGFNNASEAGILLSNVADTSISWESNNQQDVAVDFAVLKKRVSGSVEWYKRQTEGLLFNVRTPVSSGVPGNEVGRNVGDMYNKGWEVQLNVVPIKKENMTVELFVNASTFKNQLTRLPEGQEEIINGTKKLMVGHSLYDYWLRQWYGVNPDNGEGLFYLDDQYADNMNSQYDRTINGVNLTTSANRAKYDYSGTSIPDWYGSFGANFNYKGVYLNTLFTYAIGGKVYDTNYSQLMSGYPQGTALSTDILNRWQKPGDITDVPLVTSAYTYTQYSAGSTRWLVDGDYINFRSATLGYNFGSEGIKRYGMSALKLYLNAENIWAKTARKGMEPNESFNGTVDNRYSPARIISLGLNVSL